MSLKIKCKPKLVKYEHIILLNAKFKQLEHKAGL